MAGEGGVCASCYVAGTASYRRQFTRLILVTRRTVFIPVNAEIAYWITPNFECRRLKGYNAA